MCTMPIFYGVMSATAAYGTYSTVEQKQESRAVANYNASLERDKADEARRAGATASADHMRKVRRLIGSQTAAAGASGADIFSGSSGALLDETLRLGMDDASRISYNAELAALGHEASARSIKMQSSLDSKVYDGKVAKGIGQIAAYSTQSWIEAKKQ